MSELRQDRTTGNWVIMASHRGRRPNAWLALPAKREARLRFDPACPFCPGHEAELPGIIAETASGEPPGWRVRVVPNKYPAVRADVDVQAAIDHQRPGFGFHEVVIDSPLHDADLATMSAAELRAVVAVYRDRSKTLTAREGVETVVLFRNQGKAAGASLLHPHAQVIALGVAPPRLLAMSEWGLGYHRDHGRCATCDELALEGREGRRIVGENARFLAIAPYAAEHPFEIWIVAKCHRASFSAIDDSEIGDLGEMLGQSLRQLKAALDDPPYNFVIDSAPNREITAPYMHWRLRIVPGIVTWGGFELTGLPINPSCPEDDAAILRAAAGEEGTVQ